MSFDDGYCTPVLKTVLLVDDSLTARVFIRSCFEALGYTGIDYLEASEGREAIALLREYRHVDLVVSDLNMPVMDGFEFIRRLRSSPLFHELPVLIASSVSHEDQDQELMKLGAAASLKKPLNPERLIQALHLCTQASGGRCNA